MKKLFTTICTLSTALFMSAQQGPGLVISEILPNPAGTDSPFEFVELVATRTINFATTPYSVITCNNGTATNAGWITGGAISYGFEITSGTVNAGDVVYVGGSSMMATGTILRSINTGTTPGDGFGNFNSGGVFGNGGTNADGIGIFASTIASITNSSVPVDAIFYGTTIGTALVNTGLDGYQLPINDIYSGGKLQSNSFLGPEPASAQFIVASGTLNPTAGAWTTGRSWVTSATFSNVATSIILSSATPPLTVAFLGTNLTVNENVGTVNVTVNVAGANNGQAVFTVQALPFSTATSGTDYTQSPVIITLPAGLSGPQNISIPVTDDILAEKDEYIVLAFTQLYNVTSTANAAYYLYIKDNDTQSPVANNQLFLNLLGSFSNGTAGINAAEIVAHDPSTQRLYIANSIGTKLDIVNFSNPSAPVIISSINISSYGNINSVAVKDSIVAMAIENGTNPQDSGKIVFLNYNGTFIKQVKVGAMPDMITFNHAGTKVITVCEGEPNTSYTLDPDGCICSVNISGGVANVTQANVAFITFTSFNGQEALLRAQGIRIYGPGATTSKDFEPEYITISDDDQTGWVTLQENNAFAVINLQTNTVTQLIPLGYKNYANGGNAMDASNLTAGINLSQFPVYGMYQPDALSHFVVGGTPYLITANEGDSRSYSAFNEESRVATLPLDATVFPYAAYIKNNLFLGRLTATNKLGDTDNDGDFDQIYSLGGRSFSIWNGTTGSLVYDSGDDIERITSTHSVHSTIFNASNSTSPAPKDRSDDKGPEPEGTTTASINGEQYSFIGLERIGGVMIYNVSNPALPSYTGYYNNRSFATNGPDRGTEGIIYIADSLSPNGNALIILANETSSTLTIYQIETCAQRSGITITPTTPLPVCAGNTIALTGTNVANTTYQWYMNGSPIANQTSTSYTATSSGNYQLMVTNSTNACSGKTDFVNVTINPLPTVSASVSNATICNGSSTILTGSGASTYVWMPGTLNGNGVSVSPSSTTTYTVTGTNVNGCIDTATVSINVNPTPTVTATAQFSSVCSGSNVTLTGGGATTYNWQPVNMNGTTVLLNPTTTATYTVTGTNINGCTNTATVTVTVLPRPTITATASLSTICSSDITVLTATGGTSYTWLPGLFTGNPISITPSSSTTYTVTGAGTNGCSNTATVSITVSPSPTVTATSSSAAVCIGASATLTGGGASTYAWSGGVTNAVSFVPTATMTYTVTGTGSNGCTNTATTTVTVNALPTVTATSSPAAVCAGGSVTLTGGGASTYAWDNNVTDAVSFVPTATTTYMVTGTDANGCTNTAMITVNINALPTVTATSSSAAVCSGDSVTLTSGGASTYAWDNNVTDGVSFVPTATATYMVTGTDSNGCVNTASTTVAVNALPTVSLGPDITQCGGTVVLDAGNIGAIYLWSDLSTSQTNTVSASGSYTVIVTDVNGCMGMDNATITINANPTVTASASSVVVCVDDASVTLTGTPTGGAWSGPGVTGSNFDPATAGLGLQTASYSYTGPNGCVGSSTVSVQVDACVGFVENTLANGVSVYPNPNNGSFTLGVSANVGDLTIKITDMQGRVVYASVENNVNAGFVKQISLDTQSSGMYLMHIITNGEQQTKKIAVQK